MPRTAICHLKSLSPYSQSAFADIDAEKKPDKMPHDEWEKLTWRNRCHATPDGNVFVPPMALKRSLDSAASMLRIKIPGKGTSEYGKHFRAGVLVLGGLVLPERKETVPGEWFYMNADGKRGGNKRVWRCYPVIREWSGTVEYTVLNDAITQEIFEKHLNEAGSFIGVGRFRPEMGGYYGRYALSGPIEWN